MDMNSERFYVPFFGFKFRTNVNTNVKMFFFLLHVHFSGKIIKDNHQLNLTFVNCQLLIMLFPGNGGDFDNWLLIYLTIFSVYH
jgi:hypothetical protein